MKRCWGLLWLNSSCFSRLLKVRLRSCRPLSFWQSKSSCSVSETEGTCNLTLGFSTGTAKINTKWKVPMSCFNRDIRAVSSEYFRMYLFGVLICTAITGIESEKRSWTHTTLVVMADERVLFTFTIWTQKRRVPMNQIGIQFPLDSFWHQNVKI